MSDDAALFYPEPTVRLPGRKIIERQKKQLRRGERERVAGGRELARWQYTDSDWERHIIACSRRLIDPGELGAAIAEVALNVTESAVTTRRERSLWTSRTRFSLERGEELVWKQLQTVDRPEEVVVTSTGILYGAVARPWAGRSCRFFSAELEGEEPTYFVLELERRRLFWWWGRISLWVPLPRDVDPDSLLELIEPWVSGATPSGTSR